MSSVNPSTNVLAPRKASEAEQLVDPVHRCSGSEHRDPGGNSGKRQDGPVSKLCHLNMERAKGEKVQSVKQPTVFKTDLNQEIGQDRCVLQRKESFGDTAKVEEGEVRGSPALWGHTEQGHADPFPQARVCKHTVQRLSQQ